MEKLISLGAYTAWHITPHADPSARRRVQRQRYLVYAEAKGFEEVNPHGLEWDKHDTHATYVVVTKDSPEEILRSCRLIDPRDGELPVSSYVDEEISGNVCEISRVAALSARDSQADVCERLLLYVAAFEAAFVVCKYDMFYAHIRAALLRFLRAGLSDWILTEVGAAERCLKNGKSLLLVPVCGNPQNMQMMWSALMVSLPFVRHALHQ